MYITSGLSFFFCMQLVLSRIFEHWQCENWQVMVRRHPGCTVAEADWVSCSHFTPVEYNMVNTDVLQQCNISSALIILSMSLFQWGSQQKTNREHAGNMLYEIKHLFMPSLQTLMKKWVVLYSAINVNMVINYDAIAAVCEISSLLDIPQ